MEIIYKTFFDEIPDEISQTHKSPLFCDSFSQSDTTEFSSLFSIILQTPQDNPNFNILFKNISDLLSSSHFSPNLHIFCEQPIITFMLNLLYSLPPFIDHSYFTVLSYALAQKEFSHQFIVGEHIKTLIRYMVAPESPTFPRLIQCFTNLIPSLSCSTLISSPLSEIPLHQIIPNDFNLTTADDDYRNALLHLFNSISINFSNDDFFDDWVNAFLQFGPPKNQKELSLYFSFFSNLAKSHSSSIELFFDFLEMPDGHYSDSLIDQCFNQIDSNDSASFLQFFEFVLTLFKNKTYANLLDKISHKFTLDWCFSQLEFAEKENASSIISSYIFKLIQVCFFYQFFKKNSENIHIVVDQTIAYFPVLTSSGKDSALFLLAHFAWIADQEVIPLIVERSDFIFSSYTIVIQNAIPSACLLMNLEKFSKKPENASMKDSIDSIISSCIDDTIAALEDYIEDENDPNLLKIANILLKFFHDEMIFDDQ